MSQADLNLQLLMTLNDQVSAGMRRMMKDMQGELEKTTGKVQLLDRIWNKANANPNRGLIDSMRQLGREANTVLQTISKIGAGVAAGGYAVSRMAKAPMEYDRQLALMANTAFSERDTKGRIAGKAELDEIAKNASRYGGTKESALETEGKLFASGVIDRASVKKLMPTLTMASTGTGADAGDLANIVIRAKQNFGLTDAQIPLALDKATAAGQAGSFELKDMAHWLPQQMAAARLSGINGMGGFEKLLAYNQASAITAGTSDEAGNNLKNLLLKINSRDTAADAKKLGIDSSGTLAAARAKGVGGMDAFLQIANKVAMSDPAYVKLRQQAAVQTGADKKATLESMGDILQGSAIGKLVQDQQAIMALVGIMNNPDYIASVQNKMKNAAGETQRSYDTVADTTGSKVERVVNEISIATQRIFDAAAPKSFIDAMLHGAKEFPGLTTAVVGATEAIIVMTAAAAGFAGLGLLGKGGGALKAGKGLAAGAGKLALGGALLGGAAAPVFAAGYAGWEAGSWINDKFVSGTAAGDKIGEMTARLMAFLGSDEAKRSIEVNVKVENGNIVASVNKENAREAKRR